MAVRFSERNGKYMAALNALDPASENFLDANKVKPLLDLTNTEMVEAQFTDAQFLRALKSSFTVVRPQSSLSTGEARSQRNPDRSDVGWSRRGGGDR